MFSKKTTFLSLLILQLVLFSSCGSLTYVPVKTPAQLANERIKSIEKQLAADFLAQQFKYYSVDFGETELIKPPSHYVLDSLYDIKYKLEQRNEKSPDLENEIKTQQLIISLDTVDSYFIESHVFGLESINDTLKKYDIFLAEIYVDLNNKIETTKILSSATIPKKYANLYACYALKTSFLFPNTFADPAELEFYNLYEAKLNNLNESEKNAFLQFMLSVMKVASRNNTLDKQFLIKEHVRLYSQGSGINMMNEKFIKMEEFFDSENNLVNYQIDYQYLKKNEQGISVENHCDVFLDPYLQLIEIRKK